MKKTDFDFKEIRHGQTRRYGDSEIVYEIYTECDDEAEVVKFCNEVINNGRVIHTRQDREHWYSAYYTLAKTNAGWQYTITYPYDD